MITPEQMAAIRQFADELRKLMPIPKEKNDFQTNIKKIMYEFFWDMLALTEQKFELELAEYGKDLESKESA